MSTARLDRRIEQLQCKINQEINLADDKIKRNQNYLDTLLSEIADYQDKIRTFKYKSDQAQEQKRGAKHRRAISQRSHQAKLTAMHHAAVAELEEKNQEECKALSLDFEAQVEQVDNYVQEKLSKRVEPIEEKMKKVQAMIEKYQAKLEGVPELLDPIPEEDNIEARKFELERIKSLEEKLKEQNKMRMESLVAAKPPLQECVGTLEQMEQSQSTKMEALKNKITNMDAKYDERVRVAAEKHTRQKETMKRKIKDAKTRASQAHKSLKHIEKHYRNEMTSITAENEQLRVDYQMAVAREQERKMEETETKQTNTHVEDQMKVLKDRENVLLQMRNDNENLKRAIARIEHERRVAKRRHELNLPVM